MTRLRRRKSVMIVITCVVSMAIFSTIFISQSSSRTLDGNDDYDVSYGNNVRAKIYGADFGAKQMDRKPQAQDKTLVENTKIAPIFNYRLDGAALQIQASNHRLLARTNTKLDYKFEQSENRNGVEHADTEEDDNPYNYPENPIFKTGDFDEITNVKTKSNPSRNEGANGDSLEKSTTDEMRNKVRDNVRLSPSSTHNEHRFKKVEKYATSDHQPQHDVLADRHLATNMPRLSLPPGDVRSSTGLPIIADFIYWSDAVERLVPKGITAGDVERLRERIQAGRVRSIEKAQWNRCGRPKNKYIIFHDNSSFCARYRHPHDKLIHGEILSFYLSRMLGLDSVPLVVLSQVNSTSQQWRGQNLTKTEWLQGTIVALIQWIPQLADKESHVKMPPVLLDAYEGGYALNWTHPGLPAMTAGQTQLLLQWSDLILFDYITGNYDRVASMQDGAYEKGTTDIMHEHIRNLRQDWQTNKMWLIDNESGLLDSYELMYTGGESAVRFIDFHKLMLRSNCVFRESTVGRIRQLAESDDPASVLVEHTEHYDPLYRKLPGYSKGFKIFRANFHPRLKQILSWVESCKKIGRTS